MYQDDTGQEQFLAFLFFPIDIAKHVCNSVYMEAK